MKPNLLKRVWVVKALSRNFSSGSENEVAFEDVRGEIEVEIEDGEVDSEREIDETRSSRVFDVDCMGLRVDEKAPAFPSRGVTFPETLLEEVLVEIPLRVGLEEEIEVELEEAAKAKMSSLSCLSSMTKAGRDFESLLSNSMLCR